MGQAVRGIAGTGSARRDRCPRGGDGDHRGAAERPEAMSDSTPNAVLDGLDYPSRELIASIGGRSVGVYSESAGVWTFTYAPDWLAYAGRFALSPALPLSSAPLLDGCSPLPGQGPLDYSVQEEAQLKPIATAERTRHAEAFARGTDTRRVGHVRCGT